MRDTGEGGRERNGELRFLGAAGAERCCSRLNWADGCAVGGGIVYADGARDVERRCGSGSTDAHVDGAIPQNYGVAGRDVGIRPDGSGIVQLNGSSRTGLKTNKGIVEAGNIRVCDAACNSGKRTDRSIGVSCPVVEEGKVAIGGGGRARAAL